VSRAGGSVATIGWWATYPAEHVNGVMISERALKTRESDIRNLFRGNLAPSNVGELTYPPETLELVAPYLFDAPHHDDADEKGKTLGAMRVEDAAVTRVLLALRARPEPFDLEMVLLRGVDPVSHFFWKYYEPQATAYRKVDRPRPEDVARFGDVVPNHYRFVDDLLGDLVADDPSRVFVVLSDHGFEAGHQRFHSGAVLSGTHKSAAAQDGVLVLAGGPIRRGVTLDEPRIEDIAPTVLRLLGLEIARNLAGRVLDDAIEPAWLTSNPIAWVDAYVGPPADLPTGAASHDSSVDERLREELRALGYIE
jgi:predicted AlkP superfamily phosphohydrolase/phosphomutase